MNLRIIRFVLGFVLLLAIWGVIGCSLSSERVEPSRPAFEATSMHGDELVVRQSRNELLLIAFWAPWCHECVEELPVLARIHHAYADRGLHVVAVCTADRFENFQRFASKSNYPFPLIFDSGDKLKERFSIDSVPALILLGKNGAPVKLKHRGDESDRMTGEIAPQWVELKQAIETELARPIAETGQKN